MSIRTFASVPKPTTVNTAYTPRSIPGVSQAIELFGGWATTAAYAACAIAFVAGAGYIAWDRLTEHGGGKGTKAAGAAMIGTVLIASSTAILQQVQSGGA